MDMIMCVMPELKQLYVEPFYCQGEVYDCNQEM